MSYIVILMSFQTFSSINYGFVETSRIKVPILSLQSISGDVADNVSHPRRLDPTMELITYSFVFYLQHGRHDVKCKPSMHRNFIPTFYGLSVNIT